MAFDYPVTLDLGGRRCVLAGSGPLAVERLAGLVESGADVLLVSPEPTEELASAAATADVALHRRPLAVDDLDGAFLAILTREDDHPVPELYAAARERGVLFAALDDVAHCDFGAMSQIRRGDLRVTVSTAGRAPALAKRLRRWLEEELDPGLGELVEAIDAVKQRYGRRDVDFPTWSARWADAMSDLDTLLAALGQGRRTDVERHILMALRGPQERGGRGGDWR